MAHYILPTDFSDSALNAARFAFLHFGGSRMHAHIIHAYLEPRTHRDLDPDIADQVRKQLTKELNLFKGRCRTLDDKAELTTSLTHRWLPDVMNEVAEKEGTELVIMGAHGAGGSPLVGSATSKVVMEAMTPVIIVPKQWQAEPIRRILFAHDGGPVDAGTLKPLLELADRKKAEIIVAHVRTDPRTFLDRADRSALKELLGAAPHKFVTVQGKDVPTTINEMASQGRIQLVASVHRERGFWKGLLHSSRSKRMALYTSTPLLVLRHRSEA